MRIPAQASNEREFTRDPLATTYLAPGNLQRFHAPVRPSNTLDAQAYVDETVTKLNETFEAALGIHTRTDDRRRADCVASLKILFVLERIAQSLLVIATSDSEFVRTNESFDVIDLVSSLATTTLQNRIEALPRSAGTSNAQYNQHFHRLTRNKEPALGDALISDAAFTDLVQPSLQSWASAFSGTT